ncbi:mechanosensitive ion channel family protein [Salipiger bermudensis]|uniref:mechanosensitive ion channel family protein n=1 Tax=Salipiger bermudensis TaxID=344736 RepID=UPI001C99B8DC|nr:mechanosensitive ion channel domain-containing protein [Salipiger bermudensis]MBY6005637.1 mechanosensitive ion channel family protein [Salipiger bermudensis]
MLHLARALPLCLVALLLALLIAPPARAQEQAGLDAWYRVTEVNPGLGTPPDNIDRTTPRSSLESFLFRADAEEWGEAAHLLDLSAIPAEKQAEIGPERAEQFATLLDRRIIIDWYDLRDRPDGVDARTTDAPMAGEPRRSLLLWYVKLGDRPVPIRINRIKPAIGEPVWLVSRQTVMSLPALADAYGPTEFELMLPEPLRQKAFWGLRWYEVGAFPLVLMITALVGFLFNKAMSKGLGRTHRDAPTSMLVATRGPLTLAVVTLTISLLTSKVFVFSGRIDTVLSPLIILGYVVATLWLIVNVADVILSRLVNFDDEELAAMGDGMEQRRNIATRVSAARRAVIVIVVLVGAGITINEASVMRSLGLSLLAGAGTATIILAYAGRNVLTNIMASLQIALNQSARIGDKVIYQGRFCTVERIHFTFVQLRVWTGSRLVVPVVDFVSEPFENWTMKEHFLIEQVVLRLSHKADIEALRQKYEEILDGMDIPEDRAEDRGVYVKGHDVFGQEVLFLVPTPDPNLAWTMACEVREALLKEARRLDDEAQAIFPEVTPAEAA